MTVDGRLGDPSVDAFTGGDLDPGTDLAFGEVPVAGTEDANGAGVVGEIEDVDRREHVAPTWFIDASRFLGRRGDYHWLGSWLHDRLWLGLGHRLWI